MSTNTNLRYLKGIIENDFSVLQEIYRNSLPQVSKYILQNSGTSDDAKDVFQEGILAVFRRAAKGDLVLTTEFHYYIFAVCKKIWLKKLKKNRFQQVPLAQVEEYMMEEDHLEANWVKSQKWALFNQQFEKLSEECRKVLKMMFGKQSSKEIAAQMGYSEDYAKRKKYKCKNRLADMIKTSADYQRLMS
ncbi:MAG: sigma-70 family RNA polymerase sigma factor [Bacteroidota bacterium]